MRNPLLRTGLVVLLLGCGVPAARVDEKPAFDQVSHVDAWLSLWTTYDLGQIEELFLDDARLTYFSSETEGLIVGLDAVREHHRGFGFTPGGAPARGELWLEDVHSSDLGGTAVVNAIWYFGDREDRDSAGHGPMSAVYLFDGSRYKIAHMHFANYGTE